MNKRTYIIISIFLVLLVLTPIATNYAFCHLNLTTAQDLGNEQWLGFWANYLGSLLGTLATLIALYISYKQNEKSIQDSNNHHKEQLDAIQMQLAQQARLDMIPVLSVEIQHIVPSNYDGEVFVKLTLQNNNTLEQSTKIITPPKNESYPENLKRTWESELNPQFHIPYLIIRNIGRGPILNCDISVKRICDDGTSSFCPFPLHEFMPEETKSYLFYGNEYLTPEKEVKYLFTFSFSDIFGNQYKQEATLKRCINSGSFETTSPDFPILISQNKTLLNEISH